MKRIGGPTIGSGIKKMYLIDPKHVRVEHDDNDVTPEQRTEVMMASMPSGTSTSSLQQHQSLQQRITQLDTQMKRILNDRSIGDGEKLRRYLETLRKHIIGSKQLERLVREPIPVTIIDSGKMHNLSDINVGGVRPNLVDSEAQTIADPTSTKVIVSKPTREKHSQIQQPVTSDEMKELLIKPTAAITQTSIADVITPTDHKQKEQLTTTNPMLTSEEIDVASSSSLSSPNFTEDVIISKMPTSKQ